MKKAVIACLLLVVTFLMTGCGATTKMFGGTTEIKIAKGQKLVPYTVQWETKGSSIWYLTEAMEPGYTPKTYHFKEQSNHGALEGEVIFIESK